MMETVEDSPVPTSTEDIVKTNVIESSNVDSIKSSICHKSNGVDCDKKDTPGHSEAINDVADTNTEQNASDKTDITSKNNEIVNQETLVSDGNQETLVSDGNQEILVSDGNQESLVSDESIVTKDLNTEIETEGTVETHKEIKDTETIESSSGNMIEDIDKGVCLEHEIITETTVEIDNIESEITSEEVTFETEVLVEKNDSEVNDKSVIENEINDSTKNILSELGPNIELSEVFRASDVSENNNSTVRQEVFNKEELLDILEGNDDTEHPVAKVVVVSEVSQTKLSNAEIALQQLTRLKCVRKKKIPSSKGKKGDKKSNTSLHLVKSEPQSKPENKPLESETLESISDSKSQEQQPEKIVNELVMDWEDDEPNESQSSEIIEEVEQILKDSEKVKDSQQNVISEEQSMEQASVDTTAIRDQNYTGSKSGDESGPRRLSRVIKKKVIFDPDNPDTFTKGKITTKIKEVQINKDQILPKKVKPDQVSQRSKSKSPLSKLQWKKPSPKNIKQYKRLTEVDKLLMDEGAVNMIYQLTPEAPKGKKNMRTKAEFIKKIQSSTPDGKEMKFRERKKESLKYEEGEARKILGGKQRMSLSSSVKSPSLSEDFETHSADDSIIYRRHSSSSYSSSCMSPRRLSDVESGSAQSAIRLSNQLISTEIQNDSKSGENVTIGENRVKEVFKSEAANISSTEVINKDDCLSIKEKLNSKLSLALNKRKRESLKLEKPLKQKKLRKSEENTPLSQEMTENQFKFISIDIDKAMAVICIQKAGLKICVEVLKELQEALNYIDSQKDISVTLFASQCGVLCSSLDLSLLLDDNKEIRTNHAYELAETIRSLLSSVVKHSKLVCVGAWGACAGVAVALVALSDVALACEGTTFTLATAGVPPLPGAAALSARCKALPQSLVNDLVIFGRRLSASEALQGGLVSRVLWPDRFDVQVNNIAKDIASQPTQIVLLKKKLLSLKKTSEAELTFLSSLEAERDLLVEYWTSVEGQEFLRATLDAA